MYSCKRCKSVPFLFYSLLLEKFLSTSKSWLILSKKTKKKSFSVEHPFLCNHREAVKSPFSILFLFGLFGMMFHCLFAQTPTQSQFDRFQRKVIQNRLIQHSHSEYEKREWRKAQNHNYRLYPSMIISKSYFVLPQREYPPIIRRQSGFGQQITPLMIKWKW